MGAIQVRVADQLRVQNVGIQNGRVARRACHLKLQPQLFRQLGKVLQGLFRLLLLRGLVAAQFFKFDAAVAVTP